MYVKVKGYNGKDVVVREDLRAKSGDYCLCYLCEEPLANCPIATKLHNICRENNLILAVFGCSKFNRIGKVPRG